MTEPAITTKATLVAYRRAVNEDLPFIYASWLKGLRYGNSWFSLIDSDAYFKNQHDTIERIITSPNTTVKIACLKEDPDVILGFSVFSYTEFHWIFVKRRWRGIGIGKDLLESSATVVTHLTDIGVSLLKKRPNVRFNPYVT